jgi:hypothetical protein
MRQGGTNGTRCNAQAAAILQRLHRPLRESPLVLPPRGVQAHGTAGLPWSPEFMAAYEQALAGQPAPIGTERISSNALLNLLEVGPDPVTPAEGGKTLTFSAVSSLFLAAGALNSP